MVEEYFGFSGPPFKLSPDTKFFFSSKSHSKAMAYLHYGLRQAEGFIVITGEIGAGKSMLIGHMLDQLNRSNVSAATLLTTNLEAEDLLSHILSAFQIEPQKGGRTAELEAFEDFLYDNVNRGRRVLLVVDEAQNLPVRTVEELRMLTNINYQGTPLFQVFLVGQPEFRDVLARNNMEQLRQRVIASYHLEALDEVETREYIEHRLAVVGRVDEPHFTEEAFAEIHSQTGGVPRKINTLCTRLLLFCALEKRNLINSEIVKSVAAELQNEILPDLTGRARNAEAQVEAPAMQNQSGADDSVILPFVANNQQEENGQTVTADILSENQRQEEPQVKSSALMDVTEEVTPAIQNESLQYQNGSQSLGIETNETTLSDVASALAAISQEKQPAGSSVKIGGAQEPIVSPTISELDQKSASVDLQKEAVASSASPIDKDTHEVLSSVMDQVLSMRSDLRRAHKGNRKIHSALSDFEDRQADNVVQIENHIDRAKAIISGLE